MISPAPDPARTSVWPPRTSPAGVRVNRIDFLNNSTDTLVIGTHGRGIFTAKFVDCLADTDHNGFVAAFEAGCGTGDRHGRVSRRADPFDRHRRDSSACDNAHSITSNAATRRTGTRRDRNGEDAAVTAAR